MKSLETAIRAGLKDPKVSQEDSLQLMSEIATEMEIKIEGRTMGRTVEGQDIFSL